MKLFYFYVFFFLVNQSFGQAPVYDWARTMGGSGTDKGSAICIDQTGNVYTTGTFSGTADFAPYWSTVYGYCAGGVDVFVTKHDPSGNLVWVKTVGGTQADISTTIATDQNGMVYVGGYFSDVCDFDPGIGTYNLTAECTDGFIFKLDPDGNFDWAGQFAGGGYCAVYSIKIGVDNCLYTCGSYDGVIDLDPSTSTSFFNNTELFFCKLGSDGSYQWAKTSSGTTYGAAYSLALDSEMNIYITGEFYGTADLNPDIGVNSFVGDTTTGSAFVAKYDSLGNYLWAFVNDATWGQSIDTDANGNVYVAGKFYNTVDFDPGSGNLELTAYDYSESYILKLTPDGALIWAKQFGGSGNQNIYQIVVDDFGNVYYTGNFSDLTDFNPNSGSFYMDAGPVDDAFVCKLDLLGNFKWADQISSAGHSCGWSLFVADNGDIVTTGQFSAGADFDPGTGSDYLGSQGGPDAFVHKMIQGPLNVSHSFAKEMITIYPNPATDYIILESSDKLIGSDYKILNLQGEIVSSGQITSANQNIQLSNFSSGLYIFVLGSDFNSGFQFFVD